MAPGYKTGLMEVVLFMPWRLYSVGVAVEVRLTLPVMARCWPGGRRDVPACPGGAASVTATGVTSMAKAMISNAVVQGLTR
jgi:hypothetical protein